ncbi:protein tramtrack, beta isoform isoform X4 [Eurytemora carolleeae]|uniref:protein tramtrack, beta isoform isoform X4 n=1 Tax=Eurytemora carolleeae TaxID=1294199 RepID=UPI000C78AEC7|nr:protein tramtrack, beta isoform isoform X4 [Eurytemora carolleeae]|eukprot:XP_023328961.1 protein tramtrack, beta isoform-like isoform X4 [Eurytemora affinis]
MNYQEEVNTTVPDQISHRREETPRTHRDTRSWQENRPLHDKVHPEQDRVDLSRRMDEFKISRSKESMNSILEYDRGVSGPRSRGPEESQRGHDDRPRMAEEQSRGMTEAPRSMTDRRGVDDRHQVMDSRPSSMNERVERINMDDHHMEDLSRVRDMDERNRHKNDRGRVPDEQSCGINDHGGVRGDGGDGRGGRGGDEGRFGGRGGGGGYRDEVDGRGSYQNSTWRSAVGEGEGGRMGSNSEQYCLRWNSYETNILDTFGGLLASEALSDVTLFCEGQSYKAHRLVLAACSTHFSKIFSNSPLHGQLIIILDGTRSQDLEILLQFMYRGVAFLPSDRIESVLRTGEVLQVKGLFNGDNIAAERERTWSPPVQDNLKKEVEPARERDASPVPSGRIAVPPESPISHNLPIFPQQPYPRPFPTSIPSLYQNFSGFTRPESTSSKPTSSSVLSFSSSKSGHPSPSPGRDPGHQYKFSPRDRDDHFETASNGKIELGKHGRSPPSHRPSSEPFDRPSPRGKLMVADNGEGGGSPSQSRRFDEPEPQRMKTEDSPVERSRTFSGSFSDSRETLSRMSSQSNPTRSEAAEAIVDLRTNDTEERIKRENNQDFLRRLAQVNSERENQLATIQKMDLLRQATARGDHFLVGAGGFSSPLTAPLGIPASDLARIAQTVPDPNAIPGEPTSGTGKCVAGTKLKCPFCERTYGYETNLRAHIRQRHQGIRVPCPFCHRSFTRNNTVRRHIAREHRHQVKPNMIPTKFGQTKVPPDQIYPDPMHQSQQP